MLRKITTLAATVLTVGSLAAVPLLAAATPLTVSATVAATDTVTTTDATTTTWTGAAAQAVPFTVSVVTNDAAGYTFTFTGTNPAAGGAFAADGTTVPANVVPYTVAGTATDTEVYANGVPGVTVFPGPQAVAVVTNFTANLPVEAGVTSDVYTDQLLATVNPQ